MTAADLPMGTIIADGPRVMVKLSARPGPPWCEAMAPDVAAGPFTDADADWCLAHGWAVIRHGLGEMTR